MSTSSESAARPKSQVRQVDNGRRFVGIVRLLGVDQNHGLVESTEAYQAYGVQAIVGSAELGSCRDGDEVIFRIRIGEAGMPEAHSLKRLTAVDPGKLPASIMAGPGGGGMPVTAVAASAALLRAGGKSALPGAAEREALLRTVRDSPLPRPPPPPREQEPERESLLRSVLWSDSGPILDLAMGGGPDERVGHLTHIELAQPHHDVVGIDAGNDAHTDGSMRVQSVRADARAAENLVKPISVEGEAPTLNGLVPPTTCVASSNGIAAPGPDVVDLKMDALERQARERRAPPLPWVQLLQKHHDQAAVDKDDHQ